MRSLIFNALFWSISALYVLYCYAASFFLSRAAMMRLLMSYASSTVFILKHFAGITLMVRGTPPLGQRIIVACKHQSYVDGILMLHVMGDINFVIGNEVEKFPFIDRIVRKAGGTMVNHFGKTHAPGALEAGIERSHEDTRPILIYPEGGLPLVGETWRYRKGVYKLYEELDRVVVPAATNSGLRWQAEDWTKTPGPVVIEFLDPIDTGMQRTEFMDQLKTTIETRTRELEVEGQS
jgi:1-acyl-sn-glycerol-3-phosphate acyltransferase